jgi:hypothetical protein
LILLRSGGRKREKSGFAVELGGKGFWAKGYVEVEACAGTGVAPCAFLFKDVYGTKLRIFTVGEEDPGSKAYARVSGFQFICN